MTDPAVVLATFAITTAVAFPIGVIAGKRAMNETWKHRVELARRITRAEHPSVYGSHRKI
jgi:hypothetical protein